MNALSPDTLDRAALGAAYVAAIGYNPFDDDPTITPQEVRQTLREYHAERIAAARDDLDAANAYGIWNTAGRANRLHLAKLDAMTPARRTLHRIGGRAFNWGILALSYGMAGAVLWSIIGGLI